MSDFAAVLNRVQGDYAFFVRVQSDPQSALAEYQQLSADERAALSDPTLLAEALDNALPLRITITVKGKHDWVNRQPKKTTSVRAELIENAAEIVRIADNGNARRESALRLIQLLG